jgi:acyl dehydratase
VFIGDTITVTAEIVEKTDHVARPSELGYIRELVSVVNQRAETVLVLTHIYLANKHVVAESQAPS